MTTLGSAFETYGAPTLTGFDVSNPQSGVPIPGRKGAQYVRFYPKVVQEVYAVEVQINEKLGTTKVLKTDVRPRKWEMVEIVTPGDSNKLDVVAEDYHKREFWPQYKAYRENEGGMVGKDLDQCEYIPQPIVTELKYKKCLTQEQLASASDLLCGQIADGFRYREFARAMCKADTENESLTQVNVLKSELEKAQAMIQELSAAQASMKTQMDAVPAAEKGMKKRLGRPGVIEDTNENE